MIKMVHNLSDYQGNRYRGVGLSLRGSGESLPVIAAVGQAAVGAVFVLRTKSHLI